MTEREFWMLIDVIDTDLLDEGDEDAALAPLLRLLQGKQESDLAGFDEILAQKLYALDGREYAKHAGESGESGDGFLYARCYVVAQGEAYYKEVLTTPEKMPNTLDQWCEPLLFIHLHAWAEHTGKDEAEWEFETSVSYETGSHTELWSPQE